MKIYWTLKSIPELQRFGWRERGRISRRAYLKTFRHWQTWAGLGIIGLCAAISSEFPNPFSDGVSTSSLVGFFIYMLGFVIYSLIVEMMALPYIRQIVSESRGTAEVR